LFENPVTELKKAIQINTLSEIYPEKYKKMSIELKRKVIKYYKYEKMYLRLFQIKSRKLIKNRRIEFLFMSAFSNIRKLRRKNPTTLLSYTCFPKFNLKQYSNYSYIFRKAEVSSELKQ
jgi:hypothetical protein